MKLSKTIKRTLLRALSPLRLLKAIQLQRKNKRGSKELNDAQLQLYSDILRSDFLHYGYFKNPDIDPTYISLHDFEQAQLDYAYQVISKVTDKTLPVLDIGCGIGGLSRLLQKQGFSPHALTPDINQIRYITQKYPDIPVIHCKFRDMPVEAYSNFFGTIINSESFQYIHLDSAFDIADTILVDHGKWIISDYFKKGKSFEKSGKKWEDFLQRVERNRWKITFQEDMTPNIVVTLKYVHMLAERIGIPLADFVTEKLKGKLPGLYYLIEDVWDQLNEKKDKNIEIINPDRFEQEKKYMLLVLEKMR